jgi:hypothetical protein
LDVAKILSLLIVHNDVIEINCEKEALDAAIKL